MADFATESGHWYRADGTPCYTIVGSNGNERPTTVRDARALGLLPSVTTIMRLAAAPALERWKRNQVLLAALTLPRSLDENDEAYCARIVADSEEQAKRARERGSAIHGAIEQGFRGEPPDEELWPWFKSVRSLLLKECGEQEWLPERSFASSLGYGGKIDLHSRHWVIDFKGKDGLDDLKLYDEHYMQLSAYMRAIAPGAKCAVVFVDRNAPDCALVTAREEGLERGWQMFRALLELHRAKTGHRP